MVSLRVALSLGGVPTLQQLIVGLNQPARHFLCLSIWRGLRITSALNLSLTEQSFNSQQPGAGWVKFFSVFMLVWAVIDNLRFLRLLILTMSRNGGTSGVSMSLQNLTQVTQNTKIIVKLCVYCRSILSENFIFFTQQVTKLRSKFACSVKIMFDTMSTYLWRDLMSCIVNTLYGVIV